MLSNLQDQPAAVDMDVDDYFEPLVLHYVQKAMLTESAVLGTEILTLCGERWSADENVYEATSGQHHRKSAICPLCGDVYSSLASRV